MFLTLPNDGNGANESLKFTEKQEKEESKSMHIILKAEKKFNVYIYLL